MGSQRDIWREKLIHKSTKLMQKPERREKFPCIDISELRERWREAGIGRKTQGGEGRKEGGKEGGKKDRQKEEREGRKVKRRR